MFIFLSGDKDENHGNDLSFCPSPNVTYRGSDIGSNVETSFRGVHEVAFEVRSGPFEGDVRKCKLRCRNGKWLGPFCGQRGAALKRGCRLNMHPPKQIITYKNREVTIRESTIFPSGAVLEFKCNSSASEDTASRPGFYSVEGNSTLTCEDGEWSDRIPFCGETSAKGDFDGKDDIRRSIDRFD